MRSTVCASRSGPGDAARSRVSTRSAAWTSRWNGRDLRLPRSQRRRQDDHPADAGHAGPAGRRRRHDRRGGSAARARRRCASGSASWPRAAAPTASPPPAIDLVLQARMYGVVQGRRQEPRRKAIAAFQLDRVRRPQNQHLLRRAAPAARRRARRHPLAAGHLPGRADRRAGPAEPGAHVGGGAPAARRGHDDLPHHALPGRGRRALRPDLDHRWRADRRRGHPVGAQARDLRRRRHRRPLAVGHRRALRSPRSCSTHRRSSTS